MSSRDESKWTAPPPASDDAFQRRQRQAEALRRNLLRRKAQARQRAATALPDTGEDDAG